ncbi:hypothetical protein Cyrtocomes_00507 [Candidatus Cyrtobacter comes]|uniref:Uncharacterized protein n=1 Tax=Candidatus Cyrtobacter comes TaxID=675776 RepID=A0ABU5L7N3_9RICK|nr:hypothetical protein [Candidatus Cyrtobacter comes]MDZ5762137.1 hypothetical protein [Candidatus Cyrtobacter comes]
MIGLSHNIKHTYQHAGAYLKEGALIWLLPSVLLIPVVDGLSLAAAPFGAMLKLITQPIALCLFDGIDKIFDITTKVGFCRAELCKSSIRFFQHFSPIISAYTWLYKGDCRHNESGFMLFPLIGITLAALPGYLHVEGARLTHAINHLNGLNDVSILDEIFKADCNICNSKIPSFAIEDIYNRTHNPMQSGDADLGHTTD